MKTKNIKLQMTGFKFQIVRHCEDEERGRSNP